MPLTERNLTLPEPSSSISTLGTFLGSCGARETENRDFLKRGGSIGWRRLGCWADLLHDPPSCRVSYTSQLICVSTAGSPKRLLSSQLCLVPTHLERTTLEKVDVGRDRGWGVGDPRGERWARSSLLSAEKQQQQGCGCVGSVEVSEGMVLEGWCWEVEGAGRCKVEGGRCAVLLFFCSASAGWTPESC